MVGDRSNLKPLALHVPETRVRPRHEVDFYVVDIPAPAAATRPDTHDAPADFTDLAYTMVRVLDDAGQAVGPWNPRLSPDTLRRMLRHMALVRAFDERMFRALRQG